MIYDYAGEDEPCILNINSTITLALQICEHLQKICMKSNISDKIMDEMTNSMQELLNLCEDGGILTTNEINLLTNVYNTALKLPDQLGNNMMATSNSEEESANTSSTNSSPESASIVNDNEEELTEIESIEPVVLQSDQDSFNQLEIKVNQATNDILSMKELITQCNERTDKVMEKLNLMQTNMNERDSNWEFLCEKLAIERNEFRKQVAWERGNFVALQHHLQATGKLNKQSDASYQLKTHDIPQKVNSSSDSVPQKANSSSQSNPQEDNLSSPLVPQNIYASVKPIDSSQLSTTSRNTQVQKIPHSNNPPQFKLQYLKV